MAMALMIVFDVDVVQRIHDFVPRRPDVEWEEVAGYTLIYKTKHLQTYSGGPEGGYVYFYRERRPGWYRWNRNWGREATYTYIDDGVVAVKWVGQEVEYMGVLPHNYEEYDWEDTKDETTEIMTDDFHNRKCRETRFLWTLTAKSN